MSWGRLYFGLLVGVAAAGCAGAHGPAPSGTPAAEHSPALRTPAPVKPGRGVPIVLKSHKVGSKYVIWTKQTKNRKVYVLRADSEVGEYSGAQTGRSDFVNPVVTFFGEDGKHLIASAPSGTVVEKDKTVRMRGGVHARTQDGTTLTSDTLRYADETEMLHGEGNVAIDFPSGEELRGAALDWNLRDGHIAVTGAR